MGPGTASTLDAWVGVLDEIESSIPTVIPSDGLEEIEPAPPVDLPDTLGPLPPALRRRAEEVLGAVNEAIARVGSAQETIGAELEHLAAPARRTAPLTEPPSPTFVDHEA